MKKLDLEFYFYENGLLYDNKMKKIKNTDDCYIIISKYKIPSYLTNVRVVKQTVYEADNNLIFTGYDKTDKLQYFYGERYVEKRRKNKLITFLKVDQRRKEINRYININKLDDFRYITLDSIVALILNLEFKFFIRTGRKKYNDANNTTGLLTLKKHNISINNDDIFIIFKGKKNVEHQFIINKIIDQYIYNFIVYLYNNLENEDDYLFSINGSHIGESRFYKVLTKLGIKLKDIRTYGSNLILIKELWKFLNTVDRTSINNKNLKKMIKNILNKTAETIGHSKSISKKSYVIDFLLDDTYILDIVKNFNTDFQKFYNYIINKLKKIKNE